MQTNAFSTKIQWKPFQHPRNMAFPSPPKLPDCIFRKLSTAYRSTDLWVLVETRTHLHELGQTNTVVVAAAAVVVVVVVVVIAVVAVVGCGRRRTCKRNGSGSETRSNDCRSCTCSCRWNGSCRNGGLQGCMEHLATRALELNKMTSFWTRYSNWFGANRIPRNWDRGRYQPGGLHRPMPSTPRKTLGCFWKSV